MAVKFTLSFLTKAHMFTKQFWPRVVLNLRGLRFKFLLFSVMFVLFDGISWLYVDQLILAHILYKKKYMKMRLNMPKF